MFVEPGIHEVMVYALRAFFLLALPVVVVAGISGLFVSIVQSATTLKDGASAYAVRVVAVGVLLYFMYPFYSRYLTELVLLVLR